MGSPFSASKPPDTPQPRPQEVDPEDTPKLKCKICQGQIVRSVINHNEWVHEDDVMIFPADMPANFIVSQYDHEAIPDVLEVTFRDTSST